MPRTHSTGGDGILGRMAWRIEAEVEPQEWHAIGFMRGAKGVISRERWDTREDACNSAATVDRGPKMLRLRIRWTDEDLDR